jgi:hypothetical protein
MVLGALQATHFWPTLRRPSCLPKPPHGVLQTWWLLPFKQHRKATFSLLIRFTWVSREDRKRSYFRLFFVCQCWKAQARNSLRRAVWFIKSSSPCYRHSTCTPQRFHGSGQDNPPQNMVEVNLDLVIWDFDLTTTDPYKPNAPNGLPIPCKWETRVIRTHHSIPRVQELRCNRKLNSRPKYVPMALERLPVSGSY